MKLEEYSPAFTTIAPYYDQLMAFVNYRSWVTHIETILILNNIKKKEIFDLACGTGICLELWLDRGYKVIGLDSSSSMLEICEKKFPNHIENGDVILMLGNMKNFALPSKVPIVTCLYDSLNYLLTDEDLLSCFKCVFDALTDDGIFIFDMNTIHALRDEWGNRIFQRYDGPISSIWDNNYDPQRGVSTLRLILNINEDGKEVILKELHQERGFQLTDVGNLLNRACFRYSLYRHLTFIPATESDLRIMGIAKKV